MAGNGSRLKSSLVPNHRGNQCVLTAPHTGLAIIKITSSSYRWINYIYNYYTKLLHIYIFICVFYSNACQSLTWTLAGWSQPTRWIKLQLSDRCGGGHYSMSEWEVNACAGCVTCGAGKRCMSMDARLHNLVSMCTSFLGGCSTRIYVDSGKYRGLVRLCGVMGWAGGLLYSCTTALPVSINKSTLRLY
jgi:hypothetical protein